MFRTVERWLSNTSNLFTLLPIIFGGTIASILLAWSTWATDKFSSYAPFSWIFAGVFGFLAFSISCYIIATSRKKLIFATISRKFHETGNRLNPLSSEFNKIRFNVSDLISPADRVVRNKTFIDCEIFGPANIAMSATRPGSGGLDRCGFIDCAGIVIKDDALIPAAILFEDCTFLRCKLYHVMLLVPEHAFSHINNAMGGMNWLTHPPRSNSSKT